MTIEKAYNKKGQVAVLYSPGYGAGWSTWGNGKYAEFKLFDKGLVELVKKKASQKEVDDYFKSKFGDEYICTIGYDQIEIEWVTPGTCFKVDEYDGNEHLEFKEWDGWICA